ncbi:MAG: enoyl-CoA hydratase/isomerase family protein [Bacteroidia bacterium]|nr:enoyl-CoA hydratase/isomerase family protein [Bacteroidia bacterium]
MDYKNILLEIEDGIAIITINRPEALNALNRLTFSELDLLFDQDLNQIQGLKGVIVTGAGEKAFVAGADITEFSSLDDAGAMELSARGQRIFDKIEQFHLPVIAAVNGFALGGGCELAMACHIRVASESARFGQPEVNLGIIPGYGGTQRLVQYIGKSKALELLLTADMIDGQSAVVLGLAQYCLPKDEIIAKCKSIILKIAKKGPLAVREIIKAVNAYYQKDIDGFDAEVRGFGLLANSNDFKEGASAFIEKRKANFKGS